MLEEKISAAYELLRDEDVDAFNALRAKGSETDLTKVKFRSFDLKGANLSGLDLSGSSFKNADLRGLDLSDCNLEGRSFLNAKVSGVAFPSNIDPQEIILSLEHGTRIRLNV